MIKYAKVIYKLINERRDEKLEENIIALFTAYKDLHYDGASTHIETGERTLFFYNKKGVDNETSKG